MKTLLTFLLLATGCGSSSHSSSDYGPNESQQDPPYYVAEYQALARPHLGQDFTVTTTIQLVDALSDGHEAAAASCYSTENRIEVLKSYWDARNGVERKETLFHELAHCNQYRPHLETKLPTGAPASLMTGGALPDWGTFQANEEYYETELFSVTETCGKGDALACRK